MTCNIRYSNFNSFYEPNPGSAININSKYVKINNNEFINCSSAQTGGAIYAAYCTIESHCCLFYRCYVNNHTDTSWGNALRVENSTVIMKTITINQCGVDDIKSGDSAGFFQLSKTEFKFMNFSSNYGIAGGFMVSCMYPVAGSTGKYMNGIDGHDHFFIEDWYQSMAYQYCNFIDGVKLSFMFYCRATTLTLKNCFFKNANTKLNGYQGTIEMINCSSDVKYNGYTFIDSQDLIYISIETNCATVRIVTCEQNYIEYHTKFALSIYEIILLI